MSKLESIIRTGALATVLTTFSVVHPVQGNESHDPGNGNFPRLNLLQRANGLEAIQNLGAQLPAIARSYGHAPNVLRDMFLSDPRLNVDTTGRLFYLDDAAPEAADQVQQSAVVAAAAP